MEACEVGSKNAQKLIARIVGILYGFGNQALFLVTVWFLFWFLRDGALDRGEKVGSHFFFLPDHWMIRDALLAIIFAVSHSVMLVPVTRRILTKWIPAPFYDSTFCVVTCISLLVLFFGWIPSETILWQLTGVSAGIVRVFFYASWLALFYSLALTGLGYQNGWTPFYYWLIKRKPPRREFTTKGAYALIRHPVYLSFLGLVWFTPKMTLDHAVLTGIWTAYIFYGSFLKDRRLIYYLGNTYREYAARVPGYPLMPKGPLGRYRVDTAHPNPPKMVSKPAVRQPVS